MAPRKCWSRRVGLRRGNRVRIYERKPGGNLYVAVWDSERGHYSQRSLGHNDRDRATREAAELVRLRDAGEWNDSRSFTLGMLVVRYTGEATHTRDNSLKSKHYLDGCRRVGKLLVEFFRAGSPVVNLTPDPMGGFIAARRAGKLGRRPAGQTTVHGEVRHLKAMLAWATGICNEGKPLLERNPLQGFSVSKNPDPKRPIVDDDTIAKLLAVADKISPLLSLLIVTAESTGRRLSSTLGLQWSDIDFEKRTITWRGELDKKRCTWVVPLPKVAEEALLKHRMGAPAIGSALVFPMRKNASAPLTQHLAADWLKRAYKAAGINRPHQGLWHPFRRKWATDRKELPLKDVAFGGGWRDIPAMLMYQQPDIETQRKVMDNPKELQKRRGLASRFVRCKGGPKKAPL